MIDVNELRKGVTFEVTATCIAFWNIPTTSLTGHCHNPH